MIVSAIQPQYEYEKNSDFHIREYVSEQLKNVKEGSLVLFPEYVNAGGPPTRAMLNSAMPTANDLLKACSDTAREKSAMVAINVLEKREGIPRNSTYLFGKKGETVFVYDKQHLPPSELKFGLVHGMGEGEKCECICDYDGIRFAFLTCYDVYFSEQIEYIALNKPDIIIFPGYQRTERDDILVAQAKMLAFRCNSYVVKSAYSQKNKHLGGCSMIVAPDGTVLKSIGGEVGTVFADIDLSYKYYRPENHSGKRLKNDDFINMGFCPDAFR